MDISGIYRQTVEHIAAQEQTAIAGVIVWKERNCLRIERLRLRVFMAAEQNISERQLCQSLVYAVACGAIDRLPVVSDGLKGIPRESRRFPTA